MNIFARFGNYITSFFKSDLAKKILRLSLEVLKDFLGTAAAKLQSVVQEEVSKAEAEGGANKYERVFKAVKARFPEIKEVLINKTIEDMVLALTSAKH